MGLPVGRCLGERGQVQVPKFLVGWCQQPPVAGNAGPTRQFWDQQARATASQAGAGRTPLVLHLVNALQRRLLRQAALAELVKVEGVPAAQQTRSVAFGWGGPLLRTCTHPSGPPIAVLLGGQPCCRTCGAKLRRRPPAAAGRVGPSAATSLLPGQWLLQTLPTACSAGAPAELAGRKAGRRPA